MATLGREMKKARAVLGWRQKDLQAVTGLSQKYLSRVENDKADPSWSVVQRIAAALHLNLSLLSTREAKEGTDAPGRHHIPDIGVDSP